MDGPILTVKQGQLRGTIVENVLRSHYIAFKGIPYAAPPIGDLRFRDPEPPASWSGIRDASQNAGDVCIQSVRPYSTNIIGSEDCLYLSVSTTSVTECRPVMVWIHSGGFMIGTGNDTQIRPDYLVLKDVVLVSFNYRLGVLGFLNLGHEVASGNQGLKDQVAALKWVKENIASFGGDPNNITVFGASIGGLSAHLLAISPLSKGLFHKLILQSGMATCNWLLSKDQTKDFSFKIASLLGKDSKDPKEVIEFLRSIPAVDLAKVQYKVITEEDARVVNVPFAPAIDEEAIQPFLPCPIRQLLDDDHDIPIMIGYTSDEYIMFFKDISDEALTALYEDLPCFVRKLLDSNDDSEKIARLTERVKEWYFRNRRFTQNDIPSIMECLGDIHFYIPIKDFVDKRRKEKEELTYLYQFSYVGKEMTSTRFHKKQLAMNGASHIDEVSYLFYQPCYKIDNPVPPMIGTEDRTTLERLTSMWTNFAKTGNPTPVLDQYITTIWQPVTADAFYCLDIGNDLKLLDLTGYDNVLREFE